MLKTRIHKWNCIFPLWDNIIDVLSYSSQKTKIISFTVIFQLLEFEFVNDIVSFLNFIFKLVKLYL